MAKKGKADPVPPAPFNIFGDDFGDDPLLLGNVDLLPLDGPMGALPFAQLASNNDVGAPPMATRSSKRIRSAGSAPKAGATNSDTSGGGGKRQKTGSRDSKVKAGQTNRLQSRVRELEQQIKKLQRDLKTQRVVPAAAVRSPWAEIHLAFAPQPAVCVDLPHQSSSAGRLVPRRERKGATRSKCMA